MELIFFLKPFSFIALKTLKIPNTSYFYFMKYIQQNLEKSSIKVRKYLEPLIDVVGIGPDTSLCIKSSVEATLVAFPTSYLFSGCLPTKQPDILDLMFERQDFNHFFIVELLEIFENEMPKYLMPYLAGVFSMSQ